MFALCFTRAAAAELRRIEVRKTIRRQSKPALKAIRVGLATLAVALAAAGTAFAGGKGGGGGHGFGNNGGSFRMSAQKFSQSAPRFNSNNSAPKSIGNFNNAKSLSQPSWNNHSFSTPKNLTLKAPDQFNTKQSSNLGGRTLDLRNQTIGGKVGGLTNIVKKSSPSLTFPATKRIADAVKGQPIIGNPKFGGHLVNANGNNHCRVKTQCSDWCWKQHCKPCHYQPCQRWTYWTYPTWCNLNRYHCGYYVNVPVVVVQGIDLQLLAIRAVDSGDPAQNLGPRFRVWIRNNTPTPLLRPFNMLLMAARDMLPTADLPQAGLRIEAMQPGQILPVDIRLPVQANDANLGMVHVLVDSHREIPEVFEDNNGIVLPRGEVMSVDPALLAADVPTAVPGAEINVAGEGLGLAAGQVIVKLAGLDLAADVLGWSDLGLRIKLPAVQIVNPVDAQIIAIRADGKQVSPLPLKVVPGQAQISAQPTAAQQAIATDTSTQPMAVQAMFGN
ncbi:MAG: hypothetical protein IT427_01470 [Pirellulales bacterium]|nr:hypothetical protein [Pirellulales bacterium]